MHPIRRLRTIERMFAPSLPERPDFATWSDDALCAELRSRVEAVERAQAELTALTGVWLARQAWRTESALSAAGCWPRTPR